VLAYQGDLLGQPGAAVQGHGGTTLRWASNLYWVAAVSAVGSGGVRR